MDSFSEFLRSLTFCDQYSDQSLEIQAHTFYFTRTPSPVLSWTRIYWVSPCAWHYSTCPRQSSEWDSAWHWGAYTPGKDTQWTNNWHKRVSSLWGRTTKQHCTQGSPVEEGPRSNPDEMRGQNRRPRWNADDREGGRADAKVPRWIRHAGGTRDMGRPLRTMGRGRQGALQAIIKI